MVLKNKYLCLPIFVLYSFARVSCEIRIHMKNQNTTSQVDKFSTDVSSFMVNLGKKYFKEEDVIFFVLPSDKNEIAAIVEKTVKQFSQIWSVTTEDTYCCDYVIREKYVHKVNRVYHPPGVYVIPFNQQKSFKYFEGQIKKLQKPDDFNPRGIFFVLLFTDEYGEINPNLSIRMIINLMWKNNLFATTLLLLSKNNNKITLAHAEPFSFENRCRTVMENGIHYYNISEPTDTNFSIIYEERTNLQKCVINMGTVPFPPYVVGKSKTVEKETHYDYVGGIEIELVRLLSELMNFTYKFHKTHSYKIDAWFTVLPNGTIIGLLQDLLDHNIDMAFGGFIPDYITYYKFDYSTTYKFASLSCFVSDPNVIPKWSLLFVAFPLEVWILSIFAFVSVSLIYLLMERFSTEGPKENFKGTHFADFFSINLGMGSVLDPKSSHLRVLFFAWAVYSVHYSAYTSTLFTYITNTPLQKDIITVQDLKESGLKAGLDETIKLIFEYHKVDELAKSVIDNNFYCPHLETCVRQFVEYRNFSVVDKPEAIEYLINPKQYKVHKLSEDLMTYHVSTITTRGNPVSNEFSRVTLKAVEAGLIHKWEEDVKLQYNNVKNVDIPSDGHPTPLTLESLFGSFLILIFGLLISFISFMIEIIVNQCGRNKVIIMQK